MKVTKLETQTQLKISRKKPCRELSSRTIPHVPESSGKIRRKLACGLQFGQTEKTASPCARQRHCPASSMPENPPPRRCPFSCWQKGASWVGKLCRQLGCHLRAHKLRVQKEQEFLESYFFYLLRLVDCKAHVKSENFTIAVRNDIRVFETVSGSCFVHSVKSFVQTFPSVRVGWKTCAGVGVEH